MKTKDLHEKQQEELKKQRVSSQRSESSQSSERSTEPVRGSRANNSDRRDVANEDRIREKLNGRP